MKLPVLGTADKSIYGSFKKSANGRYRSLQGLFNPRVGGPYRGPLKKPRFRSQLELRMMIMLDAPQASNVVSWMYEAKKIPYHDKSTVTYVNGIASNPVRHYIIDFIVSIRNSEGIMRTFWIETKSIHDIAVNKTKRRTKNAKIAEKIKVKNYSKWIAASKAAKAMNASFLVITENELDSLKRMIYR